MPKRKRAVRFFVSELFEQRVALGDLAGVSSAFVSPPMAEMPDDYLMTDFALSVEQMPLEFSETFDSASDPFTGYIDEPLIFDTYSDWDPGSEFLVALDSTEWQSELSDVDLPGELTNLDLDLNQTDSVFETDA